MQTHWRDSFGPEWGRWPKAHQNVRYSMHEAPGTMRQGRLRVKMHLVKYVAHDPAALRT